MNNDPDPIVPTLIAILLLAITLGPLAMIAAPAAILLLTPITNTTATTTDCTSAPQLKVLTQTQTTNAKTIWTATMTIAAEQKWPPNKANQAGIITLATVMQESALGTYPGWDTPNSDGDAGWYQQRTLPGWYGTLTEVTNPEQATRNFLLGHTVTAAQTDQARRNGNRPAGPTGYHIPGLNQITNWDTLPVTEAAQAVQRSGFPDAYANQEPLARTLAAAFNTTSCTQTNPTQCPPTQTTGPIETGLTPNALQVLRCASQKFPEITNWAGVGDRPSNVDRDHQEGRAIDAMIPNWDTPQGQTLGATVAEWAVTNHKALGIKYIIWNARIWSTTYPDKGWQTCGQGGHCYNGTNPTLAHQDHVHISVTTDTPAQTTSTGQTVIPLEKYVLTAGFGAAGARWKKRHTGLDFAAPIGTPIRAIADGTVLYAGWGGPDVGSAYGQITRINHTNLDTEAWYAHQSGIIVQAGDRVTAGQIIGYVGQTGNVSGPHLHLEIHPGGGIAINPVTFYNQQGIHL